uniref:DNA double-strand break repair nuclease NurA n=1 Tax=Ammonifex degensii TaxID=42838 RepID=A0A7C1JBU4_9THEO
MSQAAAPPLAPVEEAVVDHRLFSPLLPEEEALASKESGEPVETATEARVKALMAELELTVALKALTSSPGALVLLDGGFVHFRARAQAAFGRLAEAVTGGAGVLVGVIEEVSSRLLSEAVGELWPAVRPFDREVLYGCLMVGEAFVVESELGKEEGTGTIFARFGAHPQPVAFDYLRVQEEEVLNSLGMLRALTPANERGVPAPVDLADRYVRLTLAEVEQLVTAAVPAALREVFLTAHRARRAL